MAKSSGTDRGGVSDSPNADRVPEHLRHLLISLEPFTVNGRTYRVTGTQTTPHLQKVMNVETGEFRWLPHEQVKNWQTLKRD
jgi:hypothetical protein